VEHLRDTLTEDQFSLYLDIESNARADEWGVQAFGTLAAIANSFGAKDAVKKFAKTLKPKKSGDNIVEIRRRMGRLASLGMVQEKK